MAKSNANQEELNCGFCLQKLTYMIEPKQLPCSHVFCLPCLEEDPKKDCPVCRRVYDAQWTGMKSFLRPSETDSDTTTEKREDNSDQIECGVCKYRKAVCYCLGCEKKLCDHDFKIHEQSSIYFTSKHHQIDIAVYASNPEKYTPVYCSHHREQKLTVACYHCHQVFCETCHPKLSSCSQSKDERGLHAISAIAMMADSMRLQLNDRIKKIADQVTEGLNLEKKSWSSLYDVECEVTKMMSEIDERVEKAIKSLRESAEQMKNELREHQAKSLSVVEAYSLQLTEQSDRLEAQWKELNRKFQDMKGSEVITKYESLKSSIDSRSPALYEASPKLPLRPKILSQNPVLKELFAEELFSQMSISSSDQKSIKIKYMKTLPSDGFGIYSVTWHGKDIVCGTAKGVLTLNEHSQKKQVNIRGHVICIRKIDKYAFAILYSKDNTEREVRISCKNTLADPKTTLCRFPQVDKIILHLSVSEQYVAACDNVGKVVRLWTTEGEHLMKIGSGHLRGPLGVLLLQDSVLVSDCETGCLHKFRLQPGSQPVWTCRGLDFPTGICVDNLGNLYVAARNTIYLIAQDGLLTKKLCCEELSKTETVFDISLSEDGTTIALSCGDEGVKIFTLTP